VYERYADPARRAIFFSVVYSVLSESPAVDSVYLLRGLMHDDNSRANTLFCLREHFPLYSGCPYKFASYEEAPKPEPALTNDAKRILARTAWEADTMRDYWIDTEHLLLGIMAESKCLAAKYLSEAGLNLKGARRTVIENKSSRPDYGPVPESWNLQSPWERWILKRRMRRYLA